MEKTVEFRFANNSRYYTAQLDTIHECPHCHRASSCEIFTPGIATDTSDINFIVQCTACNKIFFTKYSIAIDNHLIFLSNYPNPSFQNSFPKELDEISPKFIEIYDQTLTAKNSNLHELVGIGLRRAFEYLITDYIKNVLSLEPEKTLEKRIKQIDVRNVNVHATLVRWIGNDNTHVEIKHPEFSIDDMIKSIEIVVYYLHSEYISNELLKKINS